MVTSISLKKILVSFSYISICINELINTVVQKNVSGPDFSHRAVCFLVQGFGGLPSVIVVWGCREEGVHSERQQSSVCDGYISGPACSSSLFKLPRKLWQSCELCQFLSLLPSDSLCPAHSWLSKWDKLFWTETPRWTHKKSLGWELEPELVPCGQSGVKDFAV